MKGSFIILSLTGLVLGDPTDWVNPDYVIKQAQSTGSQDTAAAKKNIVRGADMLSKKGPWSVTNTHNISPPSGDIHDYISWAPYHWPDCHWCTNGHTHYVQPGNSSEAPGSDDSGDAPSDGSTPSNNSNEPEWDDPDSLNTPFSVPSLVALSRHNKMKRDGGSLIQAPIEIPTKTLLTSSTSTYPGASHAPAQAVAAPSNQKCTPSPSHSLAPSATWTACPYVIKDGNVNSDVRQLPGPGTLNTLSQAILYNALAAIIAKSPSYANTAATFCYKFFVDPKTSMNPNMDFGQIVRGPGPKGSAGTFTGILDWRGVVKIVNGLKLLEGSGSSAMTNELKTGMRNWVSRYLEWLRVTPIAKTASSRPNNHGTFMAVQQAALQYYMNDTDAAKNTIKGYFSGIFMDQIATSGEQPFEGVRTRPFHYRLFNIEAMIALAKIGDQLGMNVWTTKSNHGATIQDALDYALKSNTKNEDPLQAVPLVASIAAAYGDPTGKYASYMRQTMSTYIAQPFYFYDQTAALPNSPAAKGRTVQWAREYDFPTSTKGFQCPGIFEDVKCAEIEVGLCVTCEELEPFFEVV